MLGKAEGITAVAHKLARILYAMICHRHIYDEQKAFALTPRKRSRLIATIQRKATPLGFMLVPAPES